MVLTLTSSLNVSGVNRGSVRDMLLEALGCNVAWGIIDAFFYLLNSVGQRGQGAALLGEFTEDCRPTRGLWHGCEALPPLVATLMPPQELESLWEKLTQLPESMERLQLTKEDWLGAGSVSAGVFVNVPDRDSFYLPRQPTSGHACIQRYCSRTVVLGRLFVRTVHIIRGEQGL